MFEVALAPAAPEGFDKVIKGLFTFGAAFGRIDKLDDDARMTASKYYRRILGHLPIDLLELGVKAACAAWRFPGLPEPDAILAPINEEMAKRQNGKRRVATALARKEQEEADPAATRVELTDEERKAFWDGIAKIKAQPTEEPIAVPVTTSAAIPEPARMDDAQRVRVRDLAKRMKAGFRETDPGELMRDLSADRRETYWGARMDGKTPQEALAIACGEIAA